MASLTDWLARTFFISQDQEDTANMVQQTQQAILTRQEQQNLVDPLTALQEQAQISDTGTNFFNRVLGKPGTAGLPGLALSYWWLWLIIGLVIFTWLGGWVWVRGALAKRK